MTRRVYVYFVLTFVLGGLVGGAGVFFYSWHFGPGPRRPDKGRIVQLMTRELNLTEQQVQQVTRIMEESNQKFMELRRQHRPQFEAIREESRARTREVLTPEQAAKFDEMVRRFEERRKKDKGPPRE
jgi:Spy/CpxP family protein refolding chaperone